MVVPGGKAKNLSGSSDSSHGTEETTRLKHSYEQFGEEESKTSGSSVGIPSTADVELGMWDPPFAQEYSDLLEQRLNVGFSLPQLSYAS